VRLRVIDPDERDWTRGYLAARRFLRSRGHLRIPLDARDEHDHGYPIGQWAAVQRKQYAAGRLDTQRTRALVMLGMVWSHPDAAFDDGLATSRRYLQRTGHLAAPQNAVQDGVRVGQWLANQRRHGVLDDHPERDAALRELDRGGNPTDGPSPGNAPPTRCDCTSDEAEPSRNWRPGTASAARTSEPGRSGTGERP